MKMFRYDVIIFVYNGRSYIDHNIDDNGDYTVFRPFHDPDTFVTTTTTPRLKWTIINGEDIFIDVCDGSTYNQYEFYIVWISTVSYVTKPR